MAASLLAEMEAADVDAPAVFVSVADLIAGATERTSLAEGAGKSGARLERVVIGGQSYVLKHLDLAEDWTMRASGCLRGAPLVAWERGLLARLPACFNQPIVGVAPEDGDGPAAIGRLCPAHAGRDAVAGPGDR